MSRIAARLAHLEKIRPPEPFRPALTLIWTSPADDYRLLALERQAEAEGRKLIVIRLVEPRE